MFTDSIVGERALREIYLRCFEIAVRAAQPMSIMSSYNLINGIHAANIMIY
jgi:beta-glucosidase